MEMYKKILISILLCFGGKAIAQPSQYTPMTANGYQMKRVKVDSTLHIPSFCGLPTLRGSTSSMGALAIDTCNNKLYKYNTEFEWTEVGSNDFIDTIFRRSDSVFAKKNGITLFQFKDSVGGGGPGTTPTLQQVLTAGSTVTSNNLITGTTTTRIRQTGSGVKTASLSIDTSQIALVNQSTSTNNSFLWLNPNTVQLSAKSNTLDQTNYVGNGLSSILQFTRIPSTSRSLGVDVNGPFMQSNAGQFYFPLTLGTTGQILKLTSPTQLAWANDSSGGSSIDTTSLSNRIDERVKYTDTSSMLTPYLRKIDTASLSNRIDSKIDSLERRADSIYAFKNGQWNFQYKTLSTNTGGGASVNYYLNGSVSQGTFGGTTYYQLSKTPIAGAGTNFTRTSASGSGYIASFITDAGDPNLLNIPGGNWNLEFYFNSSSSGGTPSFYGEIYKVSATNVFTLIASGSTNPEGITNGTVVDQYFTSVPMPQTTLVATDRIAIRIFVTPGGRNITLHTEDNNLSEVLTTFSTGLNALNGLTTQVQYFQTGASGTDFNISSASDMHTFNIPNASTVGVTRGLVSNTELTAKFNTADTNKLQQKSLPAYSIMGNNTNAAANPTAVTFKQFGNQTYSDSITITGTVNPSGAINHSFRWSQIGNLVTLHITLSYTTNGSISQIAMELPDGLPIPILPNGFNANNDIICYGTGYMSVTTITTSSVFSKVYLRQNTGLTNDYEIVINQGNNSTYKISNVTIQYFAQ